MTNSTALLKDFYRLWKGPPPLRGIYPTQQQLMQKAISSMRTAEAPGWQHLVGRTIEDLRHLDVAGIERVVAIIASGRSGADLLASYLDGHDDVLMLPPLGGDRIYQFFERYQSLSLRDKLIAYPAFSADLFYSDFFRGAFPIAAADYYAAVDALFQIYGNYPSGFLESRRAFFQFLHVAYGTARGQRLTSARPLIAYAQHAWNNQLAKRLVEDFPQARFIHTVRDPITNCSRAFENRFTSASPQRFLIAAYVIWNLTQRDVPHRGMESRTVAVRFEDLHLHPEKTMQAVADWLGLPYQSSLLKSTYNGVPWVVKRGTDSWSGARPEQAIRDSRYISSLDRGLLFALLKEDFAAWNYPYPKPFMRTWVRILVCVPTLLIPMKMEIVAAGVFIKELRSLRGRVLVGHIISNLLRIFACRFVIASIGLVELCRRLTFGKRAARLSVMKLS